MTNDPNELCPVCGVKFNTRCRCRRGNMWCPNGHAWHVCKVHKVQVMGSGHGLAVPFGGCTCPKHSTESPGWRKGEKPKKPESVDLSAAASFVFDFEDPVVKFN